MRKKGTQATLSLTFTRLVWCATTLVSGGCYHPKRGVV
jgi:hypothetical protein